MILHSLFNSNINNTHILGYIFVLSYFLSGHFKLCTLQGNIFKFNYWITFSATSFYVSKYIYTAYQG